MNQNANITVTGDMSVTAGNDFIMASGTSTTVSNGNFTSRSGGNTTLQQVGVSGTMDVDATEELLLDGAITVGGNTTMHGENITQNGAMNIEGFLGLTSNTNVHQNADITSVESVSVTAGNDFIMANGTSTKVSSGNFNSTSGGNTTLQKVDVSGTMDVNASRELLLNGAITVGGDTSMHGENITQNSVMNIGGTTSLNADVNMNQNADIKSVGSMSVTAGNDFIMVDGTSTSVSSGNYTSTSGGDTTLQNVNTSVSMNVKATDGLLLNGVMNIGGSTSLSTTGNMNQNADITSVGSVNVTAGNDFIMASGVSTTSYESFSSTSGGNTTLQKVSAFGNMNVNASEALLLNGAITLGGNSTLHGENITQNGVMNIGGVLGLTAEESIHQNSNIIVSGGNMNVQAGNDFIMSSGTSTTVSAGNFNSNAGGNTVLQQLNVSGTVNVNTKDDLSLDESLEIGDSLSIISGGTITQNQNIEVEGDVTYDVEGSILMNADTETVSKSGNIEYTANGNLFISNLITYDNTVSLNVSSVNSVLDSNNSEETNIQTKEFNLTVNSFEDALNEITPTRGIQVDTIAANLNSLRQDEERLEFNSEENMLVLNNQVFTLDETESGVEILILETLRANLSLSSEDIRGFYEELEEFGLESLDSFTILDEKKGLSEEIIDDESELDLDDLFGSQEFMGGESYETFFRQLNILHDFGLPIFDLYSSQEYQDVSSLAINSEYWIEDIAI
jgi:hypothetical protein